MKIRRILLQNLILYRSLPVNADLQLNGGLFDRLIDWWIDWLIDWSIDWWIDWWIDWLIGVFELSSPGVVLLLSEWFIQPPRLSALGMLSKTSRNPSRIIVCTAAWFWGMIWKSSWSAIPPLKKLPLPWMSISVRFVVRAHCPCHVFTHYFLSLPLGCMSDPWDLQGLAHFLEHMLFMGTKKYPEENAFEKVRHFFEASVFVVSNFKILKFRTITMKDKILIEKNFFKKNFFEKKGKNSIILSSQCVFFSFSMSRSTVASTTRTRARSTPTTISTWRRIISKRVWIASLSSSFHRCWQSPARNARWMPSIRSMRIISRAIVVAWTISIASRGIPSMTSTSLAPVKKILDFYCTTTNQSINRSMINELGNSQSINQSIDDQWIRGAVNQLINRSMINEFGEQLIN